MKSEGVKLGSYVIPPNAPLEYQELFFEYRERELAWEMYKAVKSAGQACVVTVRQQEHGLTGTKEFAVTVGAAPIINLKIKFPKKVKLKDRIKILFTGEIPFWATTK